MLVYFSSRENLLIQLKKKIERCSNINTSTLTLILFFVCFFVFLRKMFDSTKSYPKNLTES